jgi:hypothetical protein
MFRYPEKYAPNPVQRFLDIYAETFKSGVDQATDMSNTITPRPSNDKQRKANELSFSQWKARLLATLRKQLHESNLADRFGAPSSPVKVRAEINGIRSTRGVFGLGLEASEIMIHAT